MIINWTAIAATAVCGLVALLLLAWLLLFVLPRLRLSWYGPRIDPNSKCPGCGNNSGVLQVAAVNTDKQKAVELFIQHTCAVCKASWYEPPVMKAEKWFVPPTP